MKSIWKICATVIMASLVASLIAACGSGGGGASGGSAPNAGKGNVDFGVSSTATKTLKSGLSPMAAAVLGNAGPLATISSTVTNVRVVVKHTATAVSTAYVLNLSAFGLGYKSIPVSLEVGAYTLEEFEVRDASNAILYATPKVGSPAASVVDAGETLPKVLSVTLAGVTINQQIVSTANQTPASFGFASFGLDLKESITFQAGAFTVTAGGGAPTRVAADVTVKADGVQVYAGSIADPVVASITIKESANAAAVYEVTVSKSGYVNYVLSGLTAAQLRRRINGNQGGDGVVDAQLNPTP